MRILRLRPHATLLSAIAWLFLAADAHALSFQADFVASTYQVTAGDGYAELAAAFDAGTPLASVAMTGFENVSAQVEAGVSGNYAIRLIVELSVDAAGLYEFQVGADWGRGGVAAVIDTATGTVLDEVVRLDDIWWANDWNDPDVFTTQIALAAGTSYTLVWLGFEGCCGGVTTIRFSFEGGPFQILNEPNLEPFVVPEAGMAALVGLGLTSLAARRRSAKSASPCVRGDRGAL
jgi:hypothetical protein